MFEYVITIRIADVDRLIINILYCFKCIDYFSFRKSADNIFTVINLI